MSRADELKRSEAEEARHQKVPRKQFDQALEFLDGIAGRVNTDRNGHAQIQAAVALIRRFADQYGVHVEPGTIMKGQTQAGVTPLQGPASRGK